VDDRDDDECARALVVSDEVEVAMGEKPEQREDSVATEKIMEVKLIMVVAVVERERFACQMSRCSRRLVLDL
jgi:hypothetical protein